MKNTTYSDEYLIKLHRKKRINAFFPLYNRYRKYGLSIVYNQLNKCKLVRSLEDEKESIVFEAINETIKSFDENKGSFKGLFSNVTMHITLRCIKKFSQDPLSNYISLDDNQKIGDEMVFMDSSIASSIDDRKAVTNEELLVIKKYYKGHYQRRIQRMVEMKRDGFSFKEIGVRYQMSSKAVRAIFYRLKKRMIVEKYK